MTTTTDDKSPERRQTAPASFKAWPDGALEAPPVLRERWSLEADGFLLRADYDEDGSLADVELPDGVYLRLLGLDLSDDAAILRFVNEWGMLGMPGFAELPQWPVTKWRRSVVRRIAEGVDGRRHIDEVRAHAWVLRDCIRVALAYSQPEYLSWDQVFERWESEPVRGMRKVLVLGPERTETIAGLQVASGSGPIPTVDPPARDRPFWAMQFLQEALNAGLAGLHPWVRFEQRGESSGPSCEWHWRAGFDVFSYSTYAAFCLQLRNHLVTHTPYRKCEWDRCKHGRFFTEQHGRREASAQGRRTALYCSKECNDAAQAQHRRDEQKLAAQLRALGKDDAAIARRLNQARKGRRKKVTPEYVKTLLDAKEQAAKDRRKRLATKKGDSR